MALNVLLFAVILVFCLIVVGLAAIYRKTVSARNELVDRVDSMVQSPDIMRKLHMLVENMSSDMIVERLTSVEKNLNSQLIALHDQQIALPNTEKLEQLLREAMDVSRNALTQEIAAIERKVEKICRTATTESIADPSLVARINDELSATLQTALSELKADANTNIVVENLKHAELRDKLETAHTQLRTLTERHDAVAQNCENVMRLVKDLPLAEELRPLRETIDQLRDKLTSDATAVRTRIDTLAGNLDKLSTVGKTATTNIDKIASAHEELSRRVIDSATALDTLRQASEATRENQRSLHDLLVTRLATLLQKSDMDELLRTVTTRERTAAATADATTRYDRLNEQLTELADKIPRDMAARVRESVEAQDRLQAQVKDIMKREDMSAINETLTTLNRTTTELKTQIVTGGDLDRMYERFVRELDRSEHYVSMSDAIDATIKAETYELSRSVAKLSDKLTAQYGELSSYVKTAKDRDTATSDSFARIDRLLDELKSLMATSPKQMAQQLSDQRDELLDKINDNREIVMSVQKELRSSGKKLIETVDELNERAKATLDHTNDVNARLGKLETRLQSLRDAVPTSTQFWSDMGKLHEMLSSHSKKTDTELNEMLHVVQNIKSMNDTSLLELSRNVGSRMDKFAATIDSHQTVMAGKNQELIDMLKELEKRIIDKVVTNVKFGNNFRSLRTSLEDTMKNEADNTNKLIKACDKRLDANSKILDRLSKLSDVDFAKLNAADNARMLQIMNEVKAQSNVAPVLAKLEEPGNAAATAAAAIATTKTQEIIDRLTRDNENVKTMLARLDHIANTVNSHGPKLDNLTKIGPSPPPPPPPFDPNSLLDRLKKDASYTSINAKLDTILRIVNDYSVVNSVEEENALPGLRREFAELRKSMKRGFEDAAADIDSKRFSVQQTLDGWFGRTKDSIDQLRTSLSESLTREENDIGKHGKSDGSVVVASIDTTKAAIESAIASLSEKLKACETSIGELVNRSDTSASLIDVIDRLKRLDESIKRVDAAAGNISQAMGRLENRPIADALSPATIAKFVDSLDQNKRELSSLLTNSRADTDRMLARHGENLTKLLGDITTSLTDEKTGMVGQLVGLANTLRQALKRAKDARKATTPESSSSATASETAASSPSAKSIDDLAARLTATENKIGEQINALLSALIASADDLSKRVSIERIDGLIANVEHIRERVDASR